MSISTHQQRDRLTLLPTAHSFGEHGNMEEEEKAFGAKQKKLRELGLPQFQLSLLLTWAVGQLLPGPRLSLLMLS